MLLWHAAPINQPNSSSHCVSHCQLVWPRGQHAFWFFAVWFPSGQSDLDSLHWSGSNGVSDPCPCLTPYAHPQQPHSAAHIITHNSLTYSSTNSIAHRVSHGIADSTPSETTRPTTLCSLWLWRGGLSKRCLPLRAHSSPSTRVRRRCRPQQRHGQWLGGWSRDWLRRAGNIHGRGRIFHEPPT